jgi:hypothetical protein
VRGYGDGTAGALLFTNAPVLVERLVALDRRLVFPQALIDVIRSAVRSNGATSLLSVCATR